MIFEAKRIIKRHTIKYSIVCLFICQFRQVDRISRVLSPYKIIRVVIIYLGCKLPYTSCDLPEDSVGHHNSSYLVLLRVGFAKLVSHLTTGRLLPCLFTITEHSILRLNYLLLDLKFSFLFNFKIECSAVYFL